MSVGKTAAVDMIMSMFTSIVPGNSVSLNTDVMTTGSHVLLIFTWTRAVCLFVNETVVWTIFVPCAPTHKSVIWKPPFYGLEIGMQVIILLKLKQLTSMRNTSIFDFSNNLFLFVQII